MRYLTIVALLIAIVVTTAPAVEVGKPAPSLDGVSWLREVAPVEDDRLLVVDLFATWLPTMSETVPELARLQRQQSKRIQVVGITSDSLTDLNAFRRKMGRALVYPVGHVEKEILKTWAGAVEAFPHTIVIDASGVVRWQGHPLDAAAAIAEIE